MNDLSLSHDLRIFLEHLTTEPGVYQMKDAKDTVLYVGKATNLKKRVSSYFNRRQSSAKTNALVSQIERIDICVTRSETEALLLESSLIKSLLPKYNILMRDDKSYPFIYLSAHAFPSMNIVRAKKKPQKGTFFGPFPGAGAVRETLSMIQKIFKIRNCNDHYFNGRTRPCLQYEIKRCTAPCTKYISEKEYQQSVKDASRFLQGKSQEILDELVARMDLLVERLAFEEAAVIRDQIKSLRQIQAPQAIVSVRGDMDVIVGEVSLGFACIVCVTIRDGDVLATQSFFPSVPKQGFQEDTPDALWQDVFSAFITFYYADNPTRIPRLILTNKGLADLQAMESVLSTLRGSKCRIQLSGRGSKARWLDFAENNLNLVICTRHASANMMVRRYQALNKVLKYHKPVSSMLCFDISHTQGLETVASCVVFDEMGPKRRDYRLYNIQNITPGDDYAAMEQAILRCFKRLIETNHLPDVLIIDGGKGQVGVAYRVLKSLNVEGVLILGIAKGVDRKAGWERLVMNGHEMTLPSDSLALHLLQHIRDEAHRFAISAHRKKRSKMSISSSIESIPGIGAKRRQALLSRFGGMQELAQATIEELTKVPGISRELAIRIHQQVKSDR